MLINAASDGPERFVVDYFTPRLRFTLIQARHGVIGHLVENIQILLNILSV